MQKQFESNSLVVTLSVKDVKAMAHQMSKSLKKNGIVAPLNMCLEVVAHQFKEETWNHLAGQFEKVKNEVIRQGKIYTWIDTFFYQDFPSCYIAEDTSLLFESDYRFKYVICGTESINYYPSEDNSEMFQSAFDYLTAVISRYNRQNNSFIPNVEDWLLNTLETPEHPELIKLIKKIEKTVK